MGGGGGVVFDILSMYPAKYPSELNRGVGVGGSIRYSVDVSSKISK